MCTAMTLQTKEGEVFFGRNMDFSYEIDPHFFKVPKSYQWINALTGAWMEDDYSFIGIGQETDGLLGFFDGVNERGLAAAALYFAGYAKYVEIEKQGNQSPIASFEFLHYILGKCASVQELKKMVKQVAIIGMEDPVTGSAAPLHWIAVDRTGDCAVIEQTNAGLIIFDNPIGVLANSPDLPWHMTNLRNYMEASPEQMEETLWSGLKLTPFGQAGGTRVLPGGFTSPDRFVRTAYLKSFIPVPQNPMEAVVSCFHIMEGVTIPKGAVMTNHGAYDYTKYTAFINTATCEYFFKTYDSLQVYKAGLFENNTDKMQPVHLG
ncbi:MAG: Penicillin amidase [Lacrimispora sp.]|nr:Penicillin amidase [Lacrimispora sp.]